MPSSFGTRLRVATRLLSPSKAQRYQTIHRFISYTVKRLGFRLYDVYTTWHKDEEFLRLWAGSAWNASDLGAKCFTLFNLMKLAEPLPGDTVECGVAFGRTSYMILKCFRSGGRTHHIFDSFEGLSEPGTEDKVAGSEVLQWQKNDLSWPETVVRRNLKDFENYKLYKGWIPDRFEEIADRRFAFVHIDVDLYQPTVESVRFFYPRLVPNGLIVCDDYGFSSCPGAKKAMDTFADEIGSKVIHLPTGQGVLMKAGCNPEQKSTPVAYRDPNLQS